MALFVCLIPSCLLAESKPFKIDLDKLLNPAPDPKLINEPFQKPYLDFLKEVYDTMDREYYAPLSEETYETFVKEFRLKVLTRLKDREEVVPDIKYLGAGLLVQRLKQPWDTFSNFFPPKEAEEFKSEVYGYAQGIGVTGRMTKAGYLVEKVELRSDSFAKGIVPGDIIIRINGKLVSRMSEEALNKALYPPIDTMVRLELYKRKEKKLAAVDVKVIEFFKETLSSVPTGIPGLFYIKINQFNEKTGDDFVILTAYFERQGMNKMIIDLRGNGGGPPLAAREIASMFFPPNTDLIYFQRKNRPQIMLRTIFSRVHFQGEIAILIDKGTGSASELFAGTLREHDRAILIGTENSAGKTYLKSMYPFNDGSVLYLVTSLAYYYNGQLFDTSGLKPDFIVDENSDLFKTVDKCLDDYYAQ